MVAPAQHVRGTAAELAKHLRDGKPVVICAKGLEQATGKLLGQVLAETLPQATQAVLSGPSFAADVARGLPAAADPRHRRRDPGPGARHRARLSPPAHLLGERCRRRAARRRGEERAGDRRRHRRGPGLGASAHAALVTRGFAELQALRRRARRQARDADGPLRPRRSAAHLRQPAVAQHEPRPRSRPGPDASRRCSAAAARWRRASTPPPPSPAWRPRRPSTCRSRKPWPPSSPATSPSTPPSTPCCRGRCGRRVSQPCALERIGGLGRCASPACSTKRWSSEYHGVAKPIAGAGSSWRM